jgi:hypothetical protein
VGALDMTGNASEWTADWYGDYAATAEMDPAGPDTGTYRVLRGGSWHGVAYDTRATYRDRYELTSVDEDRGLRVVWPAVPTVDPAACPDAPPPRVAVGDRAQITEEDPRPLNVRDAPALSANVITQADPGDVFEVVDGPVCAGDYWWWNVNLASGQRGWTAEGSHELYFYLPVN